MIEDLTKRLPPTPKQQDAYFLSVAEWFEKVGSENWTPVVGGSQYETEKVARLVAPITIHKVAHKISCKWQCQWYFQGELKFKKDAEYEIEIAFQYERQKWLPDWERSTESDAHNAKSTPLSGDRKLWFVQLFTPYITAQ